MLLNENQKLIQSKSIFLSEGNIINSKISSGGKLGKVLAMSASFINGLINKCSKYATNSLTQDKLRRYKLTGNMAEIKELLEPDCVQSFILAGKSAVMNLLLPFVAEYFSNESITAKEREAMLKQLKNDYKEARRIADEEFDNDLKKYNEQGIACFEDNIADAVKPYKW